MANSDYYIQDNSDIENQKLEAAKKMYREGNYAGALKLYLDMINTSYSFKLYYEIGRCYYKLNDFDNAEVHFNRSISLEAYKNPSYTFLGSLYYKKDLVNKAIENWVLANSYKPEDESVCLNLATAYLAKNMKFQAIFYYQRYLKYAKDKTSVRYLEIKKSLEEFAKIGEEFYKKAQRAVAAHDRQTAIQGLEYASQTYPASFDINYLLGSLLLEEKEYLRALIYLKQAYCIDSKSLDVIQKLPTVMINIGDYTGAYCCFKRILPLVKNNQKEYLEIIRALKQMENNFDSLSSQGHLEWAENYYSDNNYHFALFEYENCLLLSNSVSEELCNIVDKLKSFIKPEERIIKLCFERGGASYSNGDFRQANKYFTKIMTLADKDSSDYRFAKSRLVDV